MQMQDIRQDTRRRLLGSAFDGFRAFARKLEDLDARLQTLARDRPDLVGAKVRHLRRKIRECEPGLTMIGQVKAGKTTLVNAMTGWRDLLPADVNPWTSVVTSLHLAPGARWATRNARFTFFDETEWTNLVKQGGRMGELANRAGADDELDKVRRQLDLMRQKSRDRLGDQFELLLGQSHDYDAFDQAMIERYVCLGDDFWDDAAGDADRGRFADITRSADLWVDQPELPIALCLRDTPGVNDTFMIREQITLNALRGSRLCVMVLSATQALTSVDLALIRMISNIDTREVIIFVNRIDELADPARDIPEIRDSIRETLRSQGGPTDAEIIFGCGHWAGQALTEGIEALGQDSADALLSWAEANHDETAPFDTVEEMIWALSGMQALWQGIARRIVAGAGADLLNDIETEIGNLEQSLLAADRVTGSDPTSDLTCAQDPEALVKALNDLDYNARCRLVSGLLPLHAALEKRVDASRQTFVARATAAVIDHLEHYGELDLWTYDPSGLRVLLRSALQRHVSAVRKHGEDSLAATAQDIRAFYQMAFALGDEAPDIQPPGLPRPQAPLVLGQTIALDLRGNWWTRFWRRRKGYQACADDFARLIRQETQPILDSLLVDNAKHFQEAVIEVQAEFLDANRKFLLQMITGDRPEQDADRPAPTGMSPRQEKTA